MGKGTCNEWQAWLSGGTNRELTYRQSRRGTCPKQPSICMYIPGGSDLRIWGNVVHMCLYSVLAAGPERNQPYHPIVAYPSDAHICIEDISDASAYAFMVGHRNLVVVFFEELQRRAALPRLAAWAAPSLRESTTESKLLQRTMVFNLFFLR
jgi:hypothetical protein